MALLGCGWRRLFFRRIIWLHQHAKEPVRDHWNHDYTPRDSDDKHRRQNGSQNSKESFHTTQSTTFGHLTTDFTKGKDRDEGRFRTLQEIPNGRRPQNPTLQETKGWGTGAPCLFICCYGFTEAASDGVKFVEAAAG